jgi:endonuclease/exonuclease/phosphatase family metal-dependent hydrolase
MRHSPLPIAVLYGGLNLLLVFQMLIFENARSAAAADGPAEVKLAALNASLYRGQSGELLSELKSGNCVQAKKLASIIQTVRPDVLMLSEIDGEDQLATVRAFHDQYLAIGQAGLAPLQYQYVYQSSVNTGLASGLDINNNGKTDDPEDAWGFGRYHGQYAFAILSRYPIDHASIRTFQHLRWSQMPRALRPTHPTSGMPYFSSAVWTQLRLSSKNHVDVPIQFGEKIIHLLGSHPTPPVFDGPEDRNGCRNHDEIRFWGDYLTEGASGYIQDDQGRTGGLSPQSSFVVMGDLNADPLNGEARRAAIRGLLQHPRVVDPHPTSPGALGDSAKVQGDTSEMAEATAAFRFGNLRIDYVLPSVDLQVIDSGVFWPAKNDARAHWLDATDHHLVWVVVK